MPRTRSGKELLDAAYDRSDNIGAVARHPRPTVLGYANMGGTELWDLLIEARGPEYFRAPAEEIPTAADTTEYTLPTSFYMLIDARLQDAAGVRSRPLVPFDSQEEPSLRDPSTFSFDGTPTHYQLRRSPAGANTIAILPTHGTGNMIVVDYVPAFVDLEDTDMSLFHGVNGWEEYIVDFAAVKMATKDEEWDLVRELRTDMKMLRDRVLRLAPKRDMHRARREKDVRGPQMQSRPWGRYRP